MRRLSVLDNKIRSSIVEGVSVFLSMFDVPSVARVFCPAAPEARRFHDPAGDSHDAPGTDPTPLATTAMRGVDLPPLDALIEGGKVLALNMPAGTNPALARAVGIMLKNAWLESLLRRPATMKAEPGRYVRPAVFNCDEYQAFASVGEDDHRTYDTALTVEDPAHLEGLLAATRQANAHTTRDRLRAAVPATDTLFERLAERGEALRPNATRLLALLDDYGPQELAAAVNVALERDALGAGSITHILETRRRQRGLKPPLRLTLPDRPGLRDLDVRPHDLEAYDALGQKNPHDAGD